MRCLIFISLLMAAQAFAPTTTSMRRTSVVLQAEGDNENGIMKGFKNFFAELDAFVDDATAR